MGGKWVAAIGSAVRNFFENMLPEGTAFDHLLEYAQNFPQQ